MKSLWRAALPILLSVALPLTVHAQTTVTGVVVDAQTGAPVAAAVVRVSGTTFATQTTDSGTFSLTSARAIAGLTVSRIGYTTKDVTVDNPGAPVHVTLTPSVRELPGVQVVANNPAPSTAVLTRADLDRTTGLQLADAINTTPGVFMQTRTPFGGARITIRGYYPSTSGNSPNSNGLGYDVFLNNIPVTDATGSTVLDDIDYSTLGSIEVIKGPASSLYGSAIGGTVNFQTQRPTPDETAVRQELLSGSDGLLRTNTSIARATSTGDILVNYGHQEDNSFRPHSQSRKDFVRLNGDAALGSNQAVSAFFTYNRSNEQLAGEMDSSAFYARLPQSNPAYLANDSHTDLTSFLTGITDNYRIDNSLRNQTSVFGSGKFSNGPFAHGYTDITQFNWGARTSFGYTTHLGVADVSGTLGGQAERSNVTSNGVFITPAPPYPERPSASENYAVNAYAFTEWNFSLPQQVTVTVGGDLIHNTFAIHNLLKGTTLFDTTTTLVKSFGTVFAPRAQIAKALDGHGSIYASVSQGYSPPLLTQVTASNGTVDTDLKPESATQYEVGVQGSALDQRLNGSLALFDLDNKNKLVSETVSSVTQTINVGEQRNTGAELSLSYSAFSDTTNVVSLLRPWLAYTYTNAKYVSFKSDANNTAATVDYSNNQVARVPKNMASAGLDATLRGGFYFNGVYQYVDKVPVTFDNSTWVRSYHLLNAKVGYSTLVMHRWTLNAAVGGDNLTNSTYYSFLFVGPNYKGLAQAADGGTGDGYIIPGAYKAQYYGMLNVSVPIM